jgi:lysophospholipase L1-like esterase
MLLIEENSKLVMIGDSITDCGRTQPIGEGLFEAHGKGYVAYVAGLLGAVFPERHIRVVNMGTSGHTVRDLKARWQRDVIDLHPDWLSIMIGINDVWRQHDSPLQTEIHVTIGEYEQTLDEIVAQTRPNVKGLVLMTPYFIEPNSKDAMRATMDQYGAVVRSLAAKHSTIFVDTQAAFNKVLEHCHPAALAWDRVHPNVTGHMIIGKAFLDAVHFNW